MRRLRVSLILSFTDLIIKMVIHFNFMDYKIKLLNSTLGFNPYVNRDQLTIFNNQLHPSINIVLLIILCISTLVSWPWIYSYFYKNEYTNLYFEYGYMLSLAGVLSSLIDKLFWGGSLDYILLITKIIDLKDIYLFSSVIFMLMYLVSYINNIKMDKKKDKIC